MAMSQKFTVALVSHTIMQLNFPDQTKHFPGLFKDIYWLWRFWIFKQQSIFNDFSQK